VGVLVCGFLRGCFVGGFCFGVAAFFGVCLGVAAVFFFTCLHGVMLGVLDVGVAGCTGRYLPSQEQQKPPPTTPKSNFVILKS